MNGPVAVNILQRDRALFLAVLEHGYLALMAEGPDSAKAQQLDKLMTALRLQLRERAA